MTTVQLETFLKQFLLERGVILTEDWQSYDFIGSGHLDSFEILTMVVSLETHFQLSIPAELLANSNNALLGKFVNSLMELK